ncbi:unnamed protein product, partial [Thelazia callipaeda]|uniref:MAM domain-containing protein n=1 Tax=Thelazia callipaeda TaxID=103827 RepID=A0A0N5CJT4_THECL
NFDFKSCCWKNKGNGTSWQIYRGNARNDENRTILRSRLYEDELNAFLPLSLMNEFIILRIYPSKLTIVYNVKFILDKYFLAASVTSEQTFSSDWTSCVTCSKTGRFTIRIRSYQTPATKLKLCWKPANDDDSIYRHCTFLRTWSSAEFVNKHFTVTPMRPIQFYIKLQNHGRRAVATAVIDSIHVITDEYCLPVAQSKLRSTKLHLVEGSNKKQRNISPIHLPDSETFSIVKLSTITTTTMPPNSNSSFILNDIFGDAFAQFLVDDTDGLIDERQNIETNDVTDDGQAYLLRLIHRTYSGIDDDTRFATTLTPFPLLTFNLFACNASGGCLFDHSMCSYRSSPVSRGSTFQRMILSGHNFMQAVTRPNTLAVLETDTIFNEDHKIVFDVLEFTEGERLYGCCYKANIETLESFISITTLLSGNPPSKLFCPFATSINATPVNWRTVRYTCPRGTTKILFMCENHGTTNGTCALDNIRIHKIFDILEMEPCQKNIITSS